MDLVERTVRVPDNQRASVVCLQHPEHIGQLAARKPVADHDTVADITGTEA
nr:hypothetical protein [Kribbella catacumbae]